MSERLISCIVPCFNGARFIEETVESILAQTHRPIEIIVIDDGSTDDSSERLERFAGSVRIHRRGNGGPAAACNEGIAVAAGEFIAFLEQDDLWLAGKLARQLAEFEADAGLDYCVTQIQNFWVDTLAEEEVRWRGHPCMQPVPGYVVQTLLARRGIFERVGGFAESLRFACAADWFVRADEAGHKGLLIPEVWTRRRLHEDNFSRHNREASREQFLHVVKSMLDRRRGKVPPESS